MKRAKRLLLTYFHTYILTDQPSHRISISWLTMSKDWDDEILIHYPSFITCTNSINTGMSGKSTKKVEQKDKFLAGWSFNVFFLQISKYVDSGKSGNIWYMSFV